VLPHYQWIDIAPDFVVHLKVIAAIFIISALAVLFLFKKGYFSTLYFICLSCTTAYLLVLTFGAVHLNQNTAKPLITQLKSVMQPQDEVINYFKFYQDVPLYLGKRITLVADWHSPDIMHRDNWVREMWYGMPFQNTADWLITEDIFWQRYNSDNRVFVFLNDNYFAQFKARAQHYFILGKYNDIILLSNKPTMLSLLKKKR